MKILIVCYEDMSGHNGGVIQVIEIARTLQRRGHTVRVLAPAIGRLEREIRPVEIRYVPVMNIPILRPLSYLISAPFHLVWEILRKRPWAAIVFQTWFSCFSVALCRVSGLRTVFFVNGIIEEEMKGGTVFLALAKLIHGMNVKLAHAVATVSDAIADYNVMKFGVSRERVRVIRNGADTDLFHPMDRDEARKLAGIGQTGPVVGFVGGLFPWHGVDILVESAVHLAREMPDVRFYIVGDGAMRPSLTAMVWEKGLEGHFIFTGSVPHDSVPLYINSFDVGIMFFKPIRSYGGSPIKLYEYMACGLPVVATPLEDYGGMLERFGAGLSVDTGKPEEVARAIISLLADEDLRRRMGKKGREAAVREFSWDRCAGELEEVLL